MRNEPVDLPMHTHSDFTMSMRQRLLAVQAFVLIGFAQAGETPTRCTPDETTYFNCLVKGSHKTASVCGEGYDTVKPARGTLVYRFGPIGKPEFIYPSPADPVIPVE